MRVGLNLSFAVKRWVTPELWAPVARTLGADSVQFSFDLTDPMWPDAVLDDHARRLRAAADSHGILVHSAFIGLAHYTFNQLLHPDPAVRDFAEAWFARAFRFAAAAGIRRVGGPMGAVASRPDGAEAETLPDADYADLLARLHRLAASAVAAGIEELLIEPTPLRREWPSTVAQAQRLGTDLAGAAIPVRWCLDWGHATYRPLYGDVAGMEPWLAALAPATGVIHLQQTDGALDRHWDFSREGIVDPAAAAALLRKHGLTTTPVFLEVFYPFETPDTDVLVGIRESLRILEPSFA